MSKEIDAAIEVMDRAMDDIAELRSQLAAKDVQLAVLREQTLDECEAIARGERCVDDTGDWSDEAYNRACDHITDAIAALKSKGERDDK